MGFGIGGAQNYMALRGGFTNPYASGGMPGPQAMQGYGPTAIQGYGPQAMVHYGPQFRGGMMGPSSFRMAGTPLNPYGAMPSSRPRMTGDQMLADYAASFYGNSPSAFTHTGPLNLANQQPIVRPPVELAQNFGAPPPYPQALPGAFQNAYAQGSINPQQLQVLQGMGNAYQGMQQTLQNYYTQGSAGWLGHAQTGGYGSATVQYPGGSVTASGGASAEAAHGGFGPGRAQSLAHGGGEGIQFQQGPPGMPPGYPNA